MNTLPRRRTLVAVWLASVVLLAGVACQEPAPSGSPTPTVSEGPIDDPAGLLGEATLTFPDWPGPTEELGLGTCPTGPVTLEEGSYFDEATSVYVQLGDVVAVQADGRNHLVAAFYCGGPGEGSAAQVLAYHPVGDGLELVGKVVDTAVVTAAEGPWAFVGGVSASGDSVTVELRVRLSIGTEVPQYEEMAQQRTYGWTGSAYAQTGGPTSFLTGSTVDLSLSVGELDFAAAVGGCRTGTISITVTNHRPEAVADVAVALNLPGLGYRDVNLATCPGLPAGQGDESALVTVGTVPANGTLTVTGTVIVDVDSGPIYGPGIGRFEGALPEALYADLRVGEQRTGDQDHITVDY